MRKIAIINQKGGVGKTSTTFNLGYGLAQQKKKVLMVDMDPQANLTYTIEGTPPKKTIYTSLKDKTIPNIIMVNPHLYLVPGDIMMAGFDIEFNRETMRERLLRRILIQMDQEYDYILIDCPPSLGLILVNVLMYVNEVLVPIETEELALVGLNQLINTILDFNEAKKEDSKEEVVISYALPTKFRTGVAYHEKILEKIKKQFAGLNIPVLNPIRINVDISKAIEQKKSIIEYSPQSNGAKDYLKLTKAILKDEK